MIKKIRPYLIGAVLAVVLILGMAQAVNPQGARWHYLYLEQQWVKFEEVEDGKVGPRLLHSKILNELGNNGWEIVESGVGGYLFRRPAR